VIYYPRQGLVGPELNYFHIEKLALAAVDVVQRFPHYILFCKTTIIVVMNLFQYILTRRVIDEKISRWIFLLQEFDLEFISAKSKKSMVFAELISELPFELGDVIPDESPIKGDMFLIVSCDPWYGYVLVYFQTLKRPASASLDEHCRIRHQDKNYLILEDTLYHQGVDCILRQCLTHEEVKIMLKYCHTGACGVHFSGLETTQKILRDGYF
jgi:hypothetical protein